mmetsp:Transcript_102400/g.305833  ORF Transcript_102400/g.305833 Transcript_102400/m.305833 type:complete len:201 (-) Transcript_102400:333-935(-)
MRRAHRPVVDDAALRPPHDPVALAVAAALAGAAAHERRPTLPHHGAPGVEGHEGLPVQEELQLRARLGHDGAPVAQRLEQAAQEGSRSCGAGRVVQAQSERLPREDRCRRHPSTSVGYAPLRPAVRGHEARDVAAGSPLVPRQRCGHRLLLPALRIEPQDLRLLPGCTARPEVHKQSRARDKASNLDRVHGLGLELLLVV